MLRFGTFKYGSTKYDTPVYIDYRTDDDVRNKVAIGYINAADLNRIECRCNEVADMMCVIGFDTLRITTKADWCRTDYCNVPDMERIRRNVEMLVDVYNRIIGQPVIPHNMKPKIDDLNSLELSLKLLDKHIKNVAHSKNKWAGQTIAGGGLL